MNDSCNKITIIKGEDRSFIVRITEECTGDNYDLTGLTAAKAVFKSEVGANVEITMLASEIAVVTPATSGKLDLLISDAKTSLLKVGKDQTFEIELVTNSDTRIVQFKKAITVEARI